MKNEAFYIEKCRELIEERLAWGSSEHWQNQDFENLSQKIFEVTEVSLSSSTLKRIWGKVQYSSSPNITTLNALAQFLGYEHWRAFTSNGFQAPQDEERTDKSDDSVKGRRLLGLPAWSLFGIVLIPIFGTFVLFNQPSPKKLVFKNITFTSKAVTKGVPNTVVFDYNAEDSNADSVFIQQNWDRRRRERVSKEAKQYTSTYYTPGYFRAKLILDDSIVREHDLFIESEGWLATIDQERIPIYFRSDQINKDGTIGINPEDFKSAKININSDVITTSLYNVSGKLAVPSDNFTLDVTLKNINIQSQGVCQKTNIILLGTEGVMMLPLSIKGCVGELNLSLGENQYIDGKTNDLSAFGVDFSDWAKLRCEVKNQHISIFINEEPAFEGPIKGNIGRIVGTRIKFMGLGQVKSFHLGKL
ncbi:MAG: hypothetical protein KDC49_16315 [Saprospiraceae bacterium]|nr:hypothetical protein [Saprospiraceae bacterium]